MDRIIIGCGVGLNENDLSIFAKFSERVKVVADLANERNCKLYVDAEQSFMQAGIESFG